MTEAFLFGGPLLLLPQRVKLPMRVEPPEPTSWLSGINAATMNSGDATRGLFFFSEEDLKAVASIKNDASGQNLLAVLRHVGRLKEFKVNSGLRGWHTR